MNVEAVSEKKRRGRPPTYPTADKAALFRLWPNVTTVRSLHNKTYAATAFSIMAEVPDFRERWQWIVGSDERRIGKNAVLTELGRLERPETIFAFADNICELARESGDKLTAKEAASHIRHIRLKHHRRPVKGPSVYCLSQAILKAIDDYRAVHPGMDLHAVLDALSFAYGEVQDLAEGS
jgi:hypothetical protein